MHFEQAFEAYSNVVSFLTILVSFRSVKTAKEKKITYMIQSFQSAIEIVYLPPSSVNHSLKSVLVWQLQDVISKALKTSPKQLLVVF